MTQFPISYYPQTGRFQRWVLWGPALGQKLCALWPHPECRAVFKTWQLVSWCFCIESWRVPIPCLAGRAQVELGWQWLLSPLSLTLGPSGGSAGMLSDGLLPTPRWCRCVQLIRRRMLLFPLSFVATDRLTDRLFTLGNDSEVVTVTLKTYEHPGEL